jgi:hypothetical protein
MRRFAHWEQAGKQQMDPTPHALVLPDRQAAALSTLLESQEKKAKSGPPKIRAMA